MNLSNLSRQPILQGMFTMLVFAALSLWISEPTIPWGVAFGMCAAFNWFQTCFIQFGYGACLAWLKLIIIVFLFVEGSAAMLAMPILAVEFGAALFCGVLVVKALRLLVTFFSR
ncbi:hypothetical protein [Undibacterium baiyunense]|uniref:Uncharacterized protein n=1 Tax=Undibacterium baiyunense TaxID=2828731 RepID=A0A941DFH5_9BURK|nr:hypothetical protein [Undibacterium baiyunense]MBR7747943.1 hypothetical protein [Undibacterium baiyunense]